MGDPFQNRKEVTLKTKRHKSSTQLPPHEEWDFTSITEPFLGSAMLYEYIASSVRILSIMENWLACRLRDPTSGEETDTTVGAFIGKGLTKITDMDRDVLMNVSPFSIPFFSMCVATARLIVNGQPWSELSETQKSQLENEYNREWSRGPIDTIDPAKLGPLAGIDIDWDFSDPEISAELRKIIEKMRPQPPRFRLGRSAQQSWVRLRELAAFRIQRAGVSYSKAKPLLDNYRPDDPHFILPRYSKERSWYSAVENAKQWVWELECESIQFSQTQANRKMKKNPR
jgi:hypothetical protein